MSQITKSNARPGESVPEEPPFLTLGTPDNLSGLKLSLSSLLLNTIYSPIELTS